MVENTSMWERVDRCINEAAWQLEVASTEEQFQEIGLLCREVLISLAQVVYDPAVHPSQDDRTPSRGDAKRMLEAYVAYALAGGANEAQRRQARATVQQADDLQHARNASKRDAELCLCATKAVVDQIAIVSGHTEGSPSPSVHAEFSYRGLRIRSEEHQYLLKVRVVNQGLRTIRDFKLEFLFPDLGSIPKAWTAFGGRSEHTLGLVESEPTDNAVTIRRERHALRVTYRSKAALFPQEARDLTEAIGFRYKFDDSIYGNLAVIPPLRWILYVADARPIEGSVPLVELNNF